MRRRAVALLAGLLAFLISSHAFAEPEPPLHLTVPTTVSDGAGHSLALPPGFFLTEPTWTALDLEIGRLQEAETRLKAENTSLRTSAEASTPGWWWWVAVGVTAGAAGGFAVARL